MPVEQDQPVKKVYIYTNPANPKNPPAPLLANMSGTRNINLFRLNGPPNPNIHVGVIYLLTVKPMSADNPGSAATCNGVSPPDFVFLC